MTLPTIGINMDLFEIADQAPNRSVAYAVLTRYVDAVWNSGGFPLPVPPLRDDGHLETVLDRVHGWIFVGGKDYPPWWYGTTMIPELDLVHEQRSIRDRVLSLEVIRRKMPVLGICGGHQLLCLAMGGKLIPHIPTAEYHTRKGRDLYHEIDILPRSLAAGILGEGRIRVNSSHHQAVDPNSLPMNGLKGTARAEDGTVEAIEAVDPAFPFFLGVQWHPERIEDSDHTRSLFNALVTAAKGYAQT